MAGVYFGSFLPTKGVGEEGAPGGTGATRRGRACGAGVTGSQGPGEPAGGIRSPRGPVWLRRGPAVPSQ